MSILNEIYEYKIDFVEKQKKLHNQSDILDKIKNLPSHNFSFSKKLKNEKTQTSIIGELKRASPSLGNFVNKELNLSNIAKTYEECGVSCLSILTDEKYFKGSVEDLSEYVIFFASQQSQFYIHIFHLKLTLVICEFN